MSFNDIDSIQILATVVKLANERQKMGNLLNTVRYLDESDVQTLERLLHEYGEVRQILFELGVPKLLRSDPSNAVMILRDRLGLSK